jgi:hypothetical protein
MDPNIKIIQRVCQFNIQIYANIKTKWKITTIVLLSDTR